MEDPNRYPESTTGNDEKACTDLYTNGKNWTAWTEAQAQLSGGALCTDSIIQLDQRCECDNPLVAQKRGNDWEATFQRNKDLLKQEEASTGAKPLDLVIMGDSITEFMLGTYKNQRLSNLAQTSDLYQRLFRTEDALIRGLALGLSSDKCENMLYRLQNGEMPPDDIMNNPFVWWILIGTNNLGGNCSATAIAAGIIHIVQFIKQSHPTAIIVLNSLFPRGEGDLVVLPSSPSSSTTPTTNNKNNTTNLYWAAIVEVNEILKCFVTSSSSSPLSSSEDGHTTTTGTVVFFNATDLFLTSDQLRVNKTLMSDFIHPSLLGYLKWGESIIRTSLDLLGKPQPSPDAFQNILRSH